MSLQTPILLLLFNRLDPAKKVFEKIREVKPAKFFVAADGPRAGKAGEQEKCEAVRNYVIKNIDWACEVKTLFRQENLGCGKAVSSSITWFFENVEEGIILEDDTVPGPDFFSFCETMLEKYEEQENIKIIGGVNFQNGIKRGEASYYFSGLCHIWGWATWRRTWKQYDFKLQTISKEDVEKMVFEYFQDERIVKAWLHIYDNLKSGAFDTWDYQLALSIWKQGGINIVPQKNLVSNIGFGEDATHTTHTVDPFSNLPTEKLGGIKYASSIKMDTEADKYALAKIFPVQKRNLKMFAKSMLRKLKSI